VRSERAAAARKGKKRAAATPRKKEAKKLIPITAATGSTGARTGVRTGAGAAGPGASAAGSEIVSLVANWKPGKAFKEVVPVWDQVGPVVRELLLKFDLGSPERARDYLGALSRHTAARYSAGHLIESPEELLSDEALATTFGIKIYSGRSKGTRSKDLTYLRKLRLLLLPEIYGVRKEMVYGRRVVAPTYSEAELTQLLSFARQRSTPNSIHLLAALLLGLGAGLTDRELSVARGSDLVATPWGLFIETQGLSSGGNRGPRIVPILAKYEDELSALAKEFGDDLFLGVDNSGKLRDPSRVRDRSENLPIYQASKARSTWTRCLLENEVSFISLRKAGARVIKEHDLNTLAGDLEPSIESYISSVRGGRGTFDQSKHAHLMQYALGQ
jgi:integrase